MSVVARGLMLGQGPHQVGGIYAIDDRIKNDSFTYRFIRDTGPVTIPILRAVEWITNNCEGWLLTPDNLEGLDFEILSTIRGMRKPPAYKTEHSYIDSTGRLTRSAVDMYELVNGLHVLDTYPSDISMVIKMEQIMPFAHIRWPAYAVLWDAVHRHKAAYMGSIRPWVRDEIERLGLGIPTIGQKAPKGNKIPAGRPPVVIHPTTWGVRLVQLADTAGDMFRVTDQMRQLSRRIQSNMVPKVDRVPNVFKEKYLKL